MRAFTDKGRYTELLSAMPVQVVLTPQAGLRGAGYYAAVTGQPFMTGAHGSAHTFVLAEAQIAYRSPVRFGEPLLAGCRFGWVGRSSFGLEYRIRALESPVGTARDVADGTTVQVMFDLERNRIARVPADLIEMFEKFEGRAIPLR